MGYLKVNGARITDAGLIVRVDHETKTRIRGEIVDVFFPKHKTPHGSYQITGGRAEYLREHLTGQIREFWKEGSRFGFEVGGGAFVVDWVHPRATA